MREYFEVYGAVEPATGEKHFMVEMPEKKLPKKKGRKKKDEKPPDPEPKEKGAKSRQFNKFLQQLSEKYIHDHIVILCDCAWWHKSQYNVIPKNITLFYIPPATPEMNPIEQIWREIRTKGFHNKYFDTLQEVKNNFELTVASISPETVKSITSRDWLPCNAKPAA